MSGVAALIRSKWPEMTASQVINRIVTTAKDAGAPGKDPIYGFGVLNAEAALKDDVPDTKVNPLGTVADWIRVHRRGESAATTPAAEPGNSPTSAPATLPAATVPVAEAPSQMDSAVPAMVVIGFGMLFLAIIGGAVYQLRRASRNPGNLRDEPETGVLDKVDSNGT
ncbi:type VII secretion-associated serine protease mycosin [compost metagenome]